MKINGRQVITFERDDAYTRSRLQKCGVAKLKGPRVKKKVLLLGTGRCGTTYSVHALRTAGLRVNHERTGPDGTVSHFFVTDSDWHPRRVVNNELSDTLNHMGERRSDFDFEHIFHIVRNPLKAIMSMRVRFNGLVFLYYEENGIIPSGVKDPVLRSMFLWHEYNKLAEKQAEFTFNLEKYQAAWPVLMDSMGLEAAYPKAIKPMNKSSGYHTYVPLTMQDMIDRDAKLAYNIARMASRYGYEV